MRYWALQILNIVTLLEALLAGKEGLNTGEQKANA